MTLSERERRFVDAYLGEAAGNATKAAVLAGYSQHSAAAQASRLLKKRNVCEFLSNRKEKLARSSIADMAERREILTAHARSEERQASIKALDVLNKMDGVYIEKHQHEGGITVDVTGTRERLTGTLARVAARVTGRLTGGTE